MSGRRDRQATMLGGRGRGPTMAQRSSLKSRGSEGRMWRCSLRPWSPIRCWLRSSRLSSYLTRRLMNAGLLELRRTAADSRAPGEFSATVTILTTMAGTRASVGSQSTQPHLEVGTSYHPLRPTTLQTPS